MDDDDLAFFLEELLGTQDFRQNLLDQFEDLEEDDYPQATSSDYKWYDKYELNPTEHLHEQMRDRPRQFGNILNSLDKNVQLIADPEAPLNEKIEAALNFKVFRDQIGQLGH